MLVVTGSATIEEGASLTVVPIDRLALGHEYNIMTVAGGLTGTFMEFDTDFVFLDEIVAPTLDADCWRLRECAVIWRRYMTVFAGFRPMCKGAA